MDLDTVQNSVVNWMFWRNESWFSLMVHFSAWNLFCLDDRLVIVLQWWKHSDYWENFNLTDVYSLLALALAKACSFNVLVNLFITSLGEANVGCYVDGSLCRWLMYVDDSILLAPSVIGLQHVLDISYTTSKYLSFSFNCTKFHCICFGFSYKL